MKGSNNGSAKLSASDLRRQRRHFTRQHKVAIVKQHWIDGLVVSDLCDKYQVRASPNRIVACRASSAAGGGRRRL